MSKLSELNIIAFIPSSNLSRSESFYKDKLDLSLIQSDELALEFNIGQGKLRVTHVHDFTIPSYTVFGWLVDNIEKTVSDLISSGIGFEKFDGFTQSELGICTFPGGAKVAWFKDPDGNTLSVTEN